MAWISTVQVSCKGGWADAVFWAFAPEGYDKTCHRGSEEKAKSDVNAEPESWKFLLHGLVARSIVQYHAVP